MLCAQDKTRTCTALRPLPPQSSVSTNFTTWAHCDGKNTKILFIFTKKFNLCKKTAITKIGMEFEACPE